MKHILWGKQKVKNQVNKYKGDYNTPFAGGVAFGYEGELGNNSYRAKLEAMHSSVKADNVGLEGSQMSVSYLKKLGQMRAKKLICMLLKSIMTKLKTHL